MLAAPILWSVMVRLPPRTTVSVHSSPEKEPEPYVTVTLLPESTASGPGSYLLLDCAPHQVFEDPVSILEPDKF